jgi:hypothetical protein
MANTSHLGIYPDTTALDHDAQIHLRKALVHLRSAGVSHEDAIASMRRALDELEPRITE